MKKSIFAVAVASALTLGAAQAETVLYGSIRYDYQNTKSETKVDGKKVGESHRLSNLADAGSRIGLKGSEDLGNGNAVIYNLEWGFDGMQNGGVDAKEGFTNRKAYLGLTGNWGTFTAGRQDNPFKVTIVDDSVTDDFNGSDIKSSAAQRAMTSALTAASPAVNTATDAGLSRVGKVIAYTTPDFAGFSANVALMMDKNLYAKNEEKNIDLWTINAKYAYELAGGELLVKAGYITGKVADTAVANKKAANVWGLMAAYRQDAFAVSAAYADGTHKNEGNIAKEKSKGFDLGASYSFGANHFSTVRVAYGENTLKQAGNKEKVKSWAVGFEQKLSTRTRAWIEYGNEQSKYENSKVKNDVISIGMRHDF